MAPLPALGVRPGDVVLVVGAHPDDETLGAGATIATLASAGVHVHAVSMSAGEAALDHLRRTAGDLGDRRRGEYAEACRALGTTSSTIAGLPDGRLAASGPELRSAVTEMTRRVGATCLLSVWWGDPHPDHAAVGCACVDVARARSLRVRGYPVWAQHWTEPSRVLRHHQVQRMRVRAVAQEARRRAVACYRSQTEPLLDDLEPVLPAEVVAWAPEMVLAP